MSRDWKDGTKSILDQVPSKLPTLAVALASPRFTREEPNVPELDMTQMLSVALPFPLIRKLIYWKYDRHRSLLYLLHLL